MTTLMTIALVIWTIIGIIILLTALIVLRLLAILTFQTIKKSNDEIEETLINKGLKKN